ncbi:MAG TPA: methyltransferase domain-containing protein [Vicinamibacterales bacterium]
MVGSLARVIVRRATRFWTVSVARRTEYGRVWDSVSQSRDDARRAVAGYADEEEWARSGRETAQDIATETGLRPDDVVLEIGCGAARVGVHLAPRCARWIGCDVSAGMLAHARTALAGHANVSFVHLDGNGLDGVADTSVDVVYCTTVFMHLEEWDRYRYVREAFRVLKPGGRFYVDSFSLRSPQGWALFEQLAALPPLARPPHISKASTPQELETYVQHAGFTSVRVREGDLYVTVVAERPR